MNCYNGAKPTKCISLIDTMEKTLVTPQPRVRLKPRLKRLFDLIQTHAELYDTVWDCCCDHGYLGVKLLRKQVVPRVEFVDCVAHLMTDLRSRLGEFNTQHYGVTCADAGSIALDSSHRHLVVLAGIGGELAASIIGNIIGRYQAQRIDFLLCPNTAQYQLREFLIANNFKLLEESFIKEKRWNYEILHVSYQNPAAQTAISAIGQHWQAKNQDHHAYLAKMAKHYSDQAKNCSSGKAQKVAALYRAQAEQLE
ncbi:tRNA (adenine(22)-N(1))-methyltransferase TrmK [Simiduia curdlanivorans]|uniref:tRNA (Adenine(22)-N(1))-methyltransferase TrmK n=1 Tax=Simiduia curdlanivorans TaxID=1492769 RepID=A0ABV8V654_9GAMM|nr:tRNA (adenine(22)-N(1))-methyltransferase TrmK [Simiduia curdlanivorans]MDN3638735.1 tRNA (adenine(22)-N(1))-methyltransferase TrmK [Simiduia curdlanivorans]